MGQSGRVQHSLKRDDHPVGQAKGASALFERWWARQDLNLGPTDYESAALTAELRARRALNILYRKKLTYTIDPDEHRR